MVLPPISSSVNCLASRIIAPDTLFSFDDISCILSTSLNSVSTLIVLYYFFLVLLLIVPSNFRYVNLVYIGYTHFRHLQSDNL